MNEHQNDVPPPSAFPGMNDMDDSVNYPQDERPSHWPSPDDPLLVAARTLDAVVDNGGSVSDVAANLGLNIDTLTHLAVQRVNRVNPNIDANTFALIAGAIIDGICIGVEATQAEAAVRP